MAGPQNTSAKGRVGPEDLEGLPEDPSLREVIQLRMGAGRISRGIGLTKLKKVGGKVAAAIFWRHYEEDG